MGVAIPVEFPVRERLRMPGWVVVVRSDVGGRRERLEDAWRVLPEARLGLRPAHAFAVFDGLGGEPFGQEAAWAAAENLEEALSNTSNPENLLPRLNGWVRRTQGSTTAVVAVFAGDAGTGTIASVGDSAAYVLDGAGFRLVTEKDSGGGSIVTQCLGMPDVVGHVAPVRVAPGQTVLLCTDGVDGVASLDSLTKAMRAPDLAEGIEELFAEVWAKGAPDNATVVAARRLDDVKR